MGYNKIYKQSSGVFGGKPSKLLEMAVGKIPKNSYFLDLGCGQGRDSLFMTKQGFNVTSVDASKTAVNQMEKIIKEKELKNIRVVKASIDKFKIEKNKYNVIGAFNSLQFLPKEKSIALVRKIKKNIKPKGFIIIYSFTTAEPSYKKENKSRTFFEPEELKDIFFDFSIVSYFEGLVKDSGHVGAPKPHRHGIVRMIAQKK